MLQDFFLYLVAKPIPEHVENIKSYLSRAIINDIFDSFRRVASYKARLIRYEALCEMTLFHDDPHVIVSIRDEVDYVFKLAEGELPAHLNRVLHLRYREECDIQEISERIGVPPRVVSVYLCNALKRLRYLLKENGQDGGNGSV